MRDDHGRKCSRVVGTSDSEKLDSPVEEQRKHKRIKSDRHEKKKTRKTSKSPSLS